MNSSSPAACAPTADNAFGPVVQDTCRDGFDFTLTFEHYIFILLPATLMLIAGPVRLIHLRKSPIAVPRGRTFQLVKLSAIAIFAALQLALTVLWASLLPASSTLRTASVAASSVSLAASLVFCVLSYLEHAKSVRPSTILNAYLLLSALLDAATVRTMWLSPLVVPRAIQGVFSASFGLKVMILLLEAKEKAAWIGEGGARRDQDRRAQEMSPEETAGLYGQALIWWITPLMKMGFTRLLKPLDLFALDHDMSASVLDARFRRHWQKSDVRLGGNYRLIVVCFRTLGWSLLTVVIPRLALLAFTICQPLVLNRFLEFLTDETQDARTGYGLMAAYGLVYFGMAVSASLYGHQACRSLSMLRAFLVSGIYEQTTKLSISGVDNAAVTLMSTDVDAIMRAAMKIHELWANTLQVAIATWLLSNHISWAAAGPVVVCLLSLVTTFYVSPMSKKYMVGWIGNVQKRISVTSSMIPHMKAIKMSGLAPRLSNMIAALRQDEMDSAVPFRLVITGTSAVAQLPLLISPIVAFAMFTAVSAKTGERLNPTRMFAALSLIILLAAPLFLLFEVILNCSAAVGLFKRIQDFLEKPARVDYREMGMSGRHPSGVSSEARHLHSAGGVVEEIEMAEVGKNDDSDDKIRLEGVSLGWVEVKDVVSDVNISVKKGQLVMLVGPVAAGKSTLLRGMLGEVSFAKGVVRVSNERISWCDQNPWIINGTIRQNITAFGDFDQVRYDSIIKACDLEKDLSQLPEGDGSLVGSKGIALSGGQKQRIALARAVYSLPRIALFDDVFSGLDNHTANTVFSRVFGPEGILRKNGTTVMLATKSPKFLASADFIVALKEGRVVEQGGVGELSRKSDGYVSSLVAMQGDAESESGKEVSPTKDTGEKEKLAKTSENGKAKKAEANDDLTRQMGDMTVYKYYFDNIGPMLVVLLIIMEVVNAFFSAFPTVWLKFWAESNTTAASPNERAGYYLGAYTALQIGCLISFMILIWFVMLVIAGRSGINLHQRLLTTVMRAPLSLFTSTDTGSITTRFSQDIGLVDRSLPLALVMTFSHFFTCIARAILVASASWYIVISFPALVFLFFKLQQAYLRTSRQIRLLDLEEKAPLYGQFLETISGLATLRAHAHTPASLRTTHGLIDRSQKPFYLLIMVQQWLTLVLDLTVMGLALLVTGLAVRLRADVSVGLAGVSLVQLISLAETLKLLIQFWTSLETSLGAVARIKSFAASTPPEEREGDEPFVAVPAGWPARGQVEIENLAASYDGEVNAIEGVELSIAPGQKVGVCGRTGSGKSTLLLTLLRLVEPKAGTELVIDGVNVLVMSRETLRQRVVALSQEGFVLPGSVRLNVDPFEAHSDTEIEDALRSVGLWEVIDERGGLEKEFEEGVLSHGQRQLFFVARAVLRASSTDGGGKLVLMDEATSSIDSHTESKIQEVISSKFANHTVISIAHRLDTIADFDLVVVLEKGRLVEAGNPKELLSRNAGKFKELWDASRGGQISS